MIIMQAVFQVAGLSLATGLQRSYAHPVSYTHLDVYKRQP